jgi:hypothetical protein
MSKYSLLKISSLKFLRQKSVLKEQLSLFFVNKMKPNGFKIKNNGNCDLEPMKTYSSIWQLQIKVQGKTYLDSMFLTKNKLKKKNPIKENNNR